jgi:hypothetical protein
MPAAHKQGRKKQCESTAGKRRGNSSKQHMQLQQAQGVQVRVFKPSCSTQGEATGELTLKNQFLNKE